MTAAARSLATSDPRRHAEQHIHLPSIHIRGRDGSGFDYEENFYFRGRGRRQRVERIIRFAAIQDGRETFMAETVDTLCDEELESFQDALGILMDEDNPEAKAIMEERARREFARQRRIAAGQEQVCRRCGCSQTRACSGGCIWASPNLCSRCIIL